MKRLKNIEGKKEEQLKANEEQGKNNWMDLETKLFRNLETLFTLASYAKLQKTMYNEIKEKESNLNPEKLVFVQNHGTTHTFNVLKSLLNFASDIYGGEILL